jgi:cell division ATPase FtsA
MKKEYVKQNIVFNINSDSVGVFVYEKEKKSSQEEKIHPYFFSLRKKIENDNGVSFDDYFRRVLSLFHQLAQEASKQINYEIGEIYLILSSPWISSQKRILHFEKEKEFIFSKKDFELVLKKNKEEVLHHTHDFKDHNGLVFIRQSVVGLFANGYRTKKIINKNIVDADIHVVVEVMSQKTRDSFIHIIEKVFHRDATILGHSVAMYHSFLEIFPNEDDMLHIHIDGEISEVMLIINDELKKIGTVPVGVNHLIRFLSKNMNIPFVKAKNLLLMYQNNHLHESYRDDIDFIMKKTFLFWFKSFYSFLDEIAKEYIVPDTILLIAPHDMQG